MHRSHRYSMRSTGGF